MSGHVRVWCLRHGESENVTSEVAGAVPSAPLTERGHYQAALAARALADESITRVYASTALRARQTAQAVAAASGVQTQAMAELLEVGIGRHEGSNDPAVRRQTADVLRSWVVDDDLGQQVADGETGHEVLARMTTVFQHIVGQHPGETIAVIGHVASLTVALGRLCALGAAVWGTPLPHAEPFLVEWDGCNWRCSSWPGLDRAQPQHR